MADINETPETTDENEVEAHAASVRPLQELGTEDGHVAPIDAGDVSTVSVDHC